MEQQQYEDVTKPCVDIILPSLALLLAQVIKSVADSTPLESPTAAESHAEALVCGMLSQIIRVYERRLLGQSDGMRDLVCGLYETAQRVTRDNPDFKATFGVIPDPS